MSARRLKWTVDAAGATATLVGDIDEFADLARLVAEATAQEVALDLAGVRRINSLGVRAWMKMLSLFAPKPVKLTRCSPAIVDQLNSVRNFAGHAKVKSVMLPYACDQCGTLEYDELALGGDKGAPPIPDAGRSCATCGKPRVFDDLPERYLAFLS